MPTIKNLIIFITVVIPSILSFSIHADENQATDLADAFVDGDFFLNFRYRFEHVDQDGFDKKAKASTLKSRFTYQTKSFYDLQLLTEFDNVTNIGNDLYNSTRNNNIHYPIVADPTGTEVNQAFLQYTGIAETKMKLGRQRINMDNQRFIGGVGWRQNEQTFDSVSFGNQSLSNTNLTYSYINKVKRIFGPDNGVPTKDFDSNSHLVNGQYTGFDTGTLSAYGYLLDFDNADALSSKTFGARFSGNTPFNEGQSLIYSAEFAHQSDYGDNPVNYDAKYYLFEAGFRSKTNELKLGYEVLEGDQHETGKAFRTPLATLHKFQGWTDKFLVTPSDGIKDLYIQASTKLLNTKFLIRAHHFEGEDSHTDFGDEIDFLISKNFARNYNASLKFAYYNADNFATDTFKVWLTFSAKFDLNHG